MVQNVLKWSTRDDMIFTARGGYPLKWIFFLKKNPIFRQRVKNLQKWARKSAHFLTLFFHFFWHDPVFCSFCWSGLLRSGKLTFLGSRNFFIFFRSSLDFQKWHFFAFGTSVIKIFVHFANFRVDQKSKKCHFSSILWEFYILWFFFHRLVDSWECREPLVT